MSAQKLHTTKHEGKIALVTGGTSGIGLATAQRLALEGAKVVVTGRRQPELDAAVQKIGRNASAVRGDIANLENLDVLVGAIKERHGRLDILFANAGTGELLPLGAITEAHGRLAIGVRHRAQSRCSGGEHTRGRVCGLRAVTRPIMAVNGTAMPLLARCIH